VPESDPLVKIWGQLTRRRLNSAERAAFLGRPEIPELRKFAAQKGEAWVRNAARTRVKLSKAGQRQLKLEAWLEYCVRETTPVVPRVTGAPSPARRIKPKSLADLPSTTRYTDDT
jgi:hypothetical protein